MRPDQWQHFKAAAKRQPGAGIPLSLIVDSPWLPAHLGITHHDYYFDSEVWFNAHRRVIEEFPEVIFFPSWWAEVGMAAEPSALGVRVRFWPHQTPSEERVPCRLEDLDQLAPPDPTSDGFCPLILHRYATMKQRIFDAGYTIPVVAARGPLCTASFFRGVTQLMMDLMDEPQRVLQLIDLCTTLTIDWLKAQAAAIGPCVEGILVLDDIVGMIGPDDYERFAHPFLKRICAAFPNDWVKVYHNDAGIDACLERLPDTGFDVLNWGPQTAIADACTRLGGRMTLMGNVPPLELGVRGTPEQVEQATLDVLRKAAGHPLILSVGGGVSPGMPAPNIRAMANALAAFQQSSGG
ncbi:MAG: uroporphyrinogen decarboxylase family protein [Verrucomicrobia bacterium]|nr:uroporphyrinogen decarboxylase family protein [Verrucomicrobiota bacterium]